MTHMQTGGNTSCVEFRDGNHLLICDAGTGIIPLGDALLRQNEIREITLILTHYHWDHIAGLPFFMPAFTPGWKINIFGPGQARTDIEAYLATQMREPFFPVETDAWLSDVEYIDAGRTQLTHGPIHIERFTLRHPSNTYGYRIDMGGKKIIYASDNELPFPSEGIDEKTERLGGSEPSSRETRETDTWRQAMEYMHGADFLIHDAQYTKSDYEKKRGWGHSCYIDTVNMAIDAKVKNLYLFHHDPGYDDGVIDRLHRHSLEIIKERNSGVGCYVSREGGVIEI
ncbi:MAG: MBL fold metallo-hydrolase [Gammaproteobacteria bacterium]|nr:MBL fold metallo-hydrolase [Gammaproteobacteria bacterium]NNJ84203.1 MBL fold metallo-hydrolase [Gammaproteobacteria bacterium]